MDIKTTYCEIEITYSEREDNWHFELRGRSRTAPTLAKAKEAIDAPPPKDKKPFTRIKAYFRNYSDIEEVEITSLAEGSRFGGEAWIQQNGSRKKVDRKNLLAFTEENAKFYAEYKEYVRQSEDLKRKAKSKLDSMRVADFSECE